MRKKITKEVISQTSNVKDLKNYCLSFLSEIEDLKLEIQSSQLQRSSFQEMISTLTQEKKQLEL